MDDQVIKLVLELVGAKSVSDLQAQLAALQASGTSAAAALTDTEVAAKAAADAASGLAAANAKVNASLAQDSAAEAAKVLAAADRDAADGAELLAAAERHEAEMARMAATEARELAAAERQALQEMGEAARATNALTAAGARVNAMLDAEAAEAREVADALGKEANALWAADSALENFTADASQAATANTKLGASGAAASKGMGGLQQSIVAGGYAFQDFTATSGDLGAKLNSVSNNLPQLLAGLGGLGEVLSIAATAAIAVYQDWDSIASLWETRNPFPKAAEDVAGMKRELDQAKNSLEAMDKAGSGNADQLAKYNELRARTAVLEKQIADEQERQARLKKFLESPDEAAEGRGKAYQEANRGRGQEQVDSIAEAMKRRAEDDIKAEEAAMNRRVQTFLMRQHSEEEEQAFLKEQSGRFKEFERIARGQDFGKLATDLNDRLIKGEETAGKALDRLMDRFPTLFIGLQKKIDDLDPAKKKTRDAQVDALNKEGEAAEKEALKDLDKIKKEHANRLRDELDAMKQIGGIDQAAAILQQRAKELGLDAAKAYEFIRDGLKQAIQGGLVARGFKPQRGLDFGQDQAIENLAAQVAAKAPGQEVKGQAEQLKGEQGALQGEAARNKAALDAEVKRIQQTVGGPLRDQFLSAAEQNAALRQGGGPVARNAAEERAFRNRGQVAGVDFALPEGVLEGRMQQQIAAMLRRRNATEQGARLGAAEITRQSAVGAQQQQIMRDFNQAPQRGRRGGNAGPGPQAMLDNEGGLINAMGMVGANQRGLAVRDQQHAMQIRAVQTQLQQIRLQLSENKATNLPTGHA
jgi:hypothetical protein